MEGVEAARCRCSCQCPKGSANYRNNRGNNSAKHRADCKCRCNCCSVQTSEKSTRKSNKNEHKRSGRELQTVKVGKTGCCLVRSGDNCVFRPCEFAKFINALVGNLCCQLPDGCNTQQLPQPEPQCQPQPKPEPQWQPQPEPEPQWQPQPEPEPQWQPQPELQWQPQPEPQWQPQPLPEPQWQPQPTNEFNERERTPTEPKRKRKRMLPNEFSYPSNLGAKKRLQRKQTAEQIAETDHQPDSNTEKPYEVSLGKTFNTEIDKTQQPSFLQAPEFYNRNPFDVSLANQFQVDTDTNQQPTFSHAPELYNYNGNPFDVNQIQANQFQADTDTTQQPTVLYTPEFSNIGQLSKPMNTYNSNPYDVSLPKQFHTETDTTQQPTVLYTTEFSNIGQLSKPMNTYNSNPYDVSLPKQFHTETDTTQQRTVLYTPEFSNIGQLSKPMNTYNSNPYDVSMPKQFHAETDKTQPPSMFYVPEFASVSQPMNTFTRNPNEVSLPQQFHPATDKTQQSAMLYDPKLPSEVVLSKSMTGYSVSEYDSESYEPRQTLFSYPSDWRFTNNPNKIKMRPNSSSIIQQNQINQTTTNETTTNQTTTSQAKCNQKPLCVAQHLLIFGEQILKPCSSKTNNAEDSDCETEDVEHASGIKCDKQSSACIQLLRAICDPMQQCCQCNTDINESTQSNQASDYNDLEKPETILKQSQTACCNANRKPKQCSWSNTNTSKASHMACQTDSDDGDSCKFTCDDQTCGEQNKEIPQADQSTDDEDDTIAACIKLLQTMCREKSKKTKRSNTSENHSDKSSNDCDDAESVCVCDKSHDKIDTCISSLKSVKSEKPEKPKQHYSDTSTDKSYSTSCRKNSAVEQDSACSCEDDALIEACVKILKTTLCDKNKTLKRCCLGNRASSVATQQRWCSGQDDNSLLQHDNEDGKPDKCKPILKKPDCATICPGNAKPSDCCTLAEPTGETMQKGLCVPNNSEKAQQSCGDDKTLSTPCEDRNAHTYTNKSSSTCTKSNSDGCELSKGKTIVQYTKEGDNVALEKSKNDINNSPCEASKDNPIVKESKCSCKRHNDSKENDGVAQQKNQNNIHKSPSTLQPSCNSHCEGFKSKPIIQESNCACKRHNDPKEDDSIAQQKNQNDIHKSPSTLHHICNGHCEVFKGKPIVHESNSSCKHGNGSKEDDSVAHQKKQNYIHKCYDDATMDACIKLLEAVCSQNKTNKTINTCHQSVNEDNEPSKSKPIAQEQVSAFKYYDDATMDACIKLLEVVCSQNQSVNDYDESCKSKPIAQEPIFCGKNNDDATEDVCIKRPQTVCIQNEAEKSTSTLCLNGNDNLELSKSKQIVQGPDCACACKCHDGTKKGTSPTRHKSKKRMHKSTSSLHRRYKDYREVSKSKPLSQESDCACACKCHDGAKKNTSPTRRKSKRNIHKSTSSLHRRRKDYREVSKSKPLSQELDCACACKCHDGAKKGTSPTRRKSKRNIHKSTSSLHRRRKDHREVSKSKPLSQEPDCACACKCHDGAKEDTCVILHKRQNNIHQSSSSLNQCGKDIYELFKSKRFAQNPDCACACKCHDGAKKDTCVIQHKSQNNIHKSTSSLKQCGKDIYELSKSKPFAQNPDCACACKCHDGAKKDTCVIQHKSQNNIHNSTSSLKQCGKEIYELSKSKPFGQNPDCACACKCHDGAKKDTCVIQHKSQNNIHKSASSLKQCGKEIYELSKSKPFAQNPDCACACKCHDGAKKDTCVIQHKSQNNIHNSTSSLKQCGKEIYELSKSKPFAQNPDCACACKCHDGAKKDTCVIQHKSQNNIHKSASSLKQCGKEIYELSKSKPFGQNPDCACACKCHDGAKKDTCVIQHKSQNNIHKSASSLKQCGKEICELSISKALGQNSDCTCACKCLDGAKKNAIRKSTSSFHRRRKVSISKPIAQEPDSTCACKCHDGAKKVTSLTRRKSKKNINKSTSSLHRRRKVSISKPIAQDPDSTCAYKCQNTIHKSCSSIHHCGKNNYELSKSKPVDEQQDCTGAQKDTCSIQYKRQNQIHKSTSPLHQCCKNIYELSKSSPVGEQQDCAGAEKDTCLIQHKCQNQIHKSTSPIHQSDKDIYELCKSISFTVAAEPNCNIDAEKDYCSLQRTPVCENNNNNATINAPSFCEKTNASCSTYCQTATNVSAPKCQPDLPKCTGANPNQNSEKDLTKVITNTTITKTRHGNMDPCCSNQTALTTGPMPDYDLCKALYDLQCKSLEFAPFSADGSVVTMQKRENMETGNRTCCQNSEEAKKPLGQIVKLTTKTIYKKTKHKTPSSQDEVPKCTIPEVKEKKNFPKKCCAIESDDTCPLYISTDETDNERRKRTTEKCLSKQKRPKRIQSCGSKQERRKSQPLCAEQGGCKISTKRGNTTKGSHKIATHNCCCGVSREPISIKALEERYEREEKALAKCINTPACPQNCEFSLRVQLLPQVNHCHIGNNQRDCWWGIRNTNSQEHKFLCCNETRPYLARENFEENFYRQCAGREWTINKDGEEIGNEVKTVDNFQNVIASHIKENSGNLFYKTEGSQCQKQLDASSIDWYDSVPECSATKNNCNKRNEVQDKAKLNAISTSSLAFCSKVNSEENNELYNTTQQYNSTNLNKTKPENTNYQPKCDNDTETRDNDVGQEQLTGMALKNCSHKTLTLGANNAFECAGVAYNYTKAEPALQSIRSLPHCNRASQTSTNKQIRVHTKASIGIVISRNRSNESSTKPVIILFHSPNDLRPNTSNCNLTSNAKQQQIDCTYTATRTATDTTHTTPPEAIESTSLAYCHHGPHIMVPHDNRTHHNKFTENIPSPENATAKPTIAQERTRTYHPPKSVPFCKTNTNNNGSAHPRHCSFTTVPRYTRVTPTRQNPKKQYANEATQTEPRGFAEASCSHERSHNLRPAGTKVTAVKSHYRDTSHCRGSTEAAPVASETTVIKATAIRPRLRDSGKCCHCSKATQMETTLSTTMSPTQTVGAHAMAHTLIPASARSHSKEGVAATRSTTSDTGKHFAKQAQRVNHSIGTMTATNMHILDNTKQRCTANDAAKDTSAHLDNRAAITKPTIGKLSQPKPCCSKLTSYGKTKLYQSDSLIFKNSQSETSERQRDQNLSKDYNVCRDLRSTTTPQLSNCVKSPPPVTINDNALREPSWADLNSSSACSVAEVSQRHNCDIHFDTDAETDCDDTDESDRSSITQLNEVEVSEISIDSPPRYLPLDSKHQQTVSGSRHSGGSAKPSTPSTSNRTLADSQRASNYELLCRRLSHRMYVPRRRDNLATTIGYPSPMWSERRYRRYPSRASAYAPILPNYVHDD